MYSIQSIPITNNNQQSFPSKTLIKERLAQKMAFDWLLPKQNCVFFDIVGRQLIKKSPPPVELANGLSSLRTQLLSIDAHCFSFLLVSILVDEPTEKCRNCGKRDDGSPEQFMIFLLHSIALEGTSRYYHSIVDYICYTCAKEVCVKETRSAMSRSDKKNTTRWVKTFSGLQKMFKDPAKARRLKTIDLHSLFLLMSNSVGYSVCDMQPFIDMFVQEKFAAEQISLLQGQEKRMPVTDTISLSYVQSFISCACCGASVPSSDVKLGVMSTVYYDTSRVFAVPYYICSKPECNKKWQQDGFSQSRFSKLLALHQCSMHECFRQSMQYLYFVPAKMIGIEHSEYRNKWEEENDDDDNEECKNSSALLTTVENDLLNKLFRLDKQQQSAVNAVKVLLTLCRDPCVQKLDQCVKRCLCENCIEKNLLFMDMLRKFETARVTSSETSRSELDAVVVSFCKLCANTNDYMLHSCQPVVNHNRCHLQSTSSVSSFEQDANQQFREWRLRPQRRANNGSKTRCGQNYAQTLLANDQMESFLDDTCAFLSLMF